MAVKPLNIKELYRAILKTLPTLYKRYPIFDITQYLIFEIILYPNFDIILYLFFDKMIYIKWHTH